MQSVVLVCESLQCGGIDFDGFKFVGERDWMTKGGGGVSLLVFAFSL